MKSRVLLELVLVWVRIAFVDCVVAAGEEAIGCVQPTLDAANRVISKVILIQIHTHFIQDRVKLNQFLEEKELKESFETIKGALTIVYPEGLPSWDPSRLAIEDNEDLEGTAVSSLKLRVQASKDVFNPNEANLWWAGKEMLKGKTLADYVGKNDKTKIIVKMQKVLCYIFHCLLERTRSSNARSPYQ